MVALLGLPALVGVVVVLGLMAVAAPLLPPRGMAPATAGLCLLATMLAFAAVVSGGQAQLLGGRLVVDPLSAFFLMLIGFAGFVAACGRLHRTVSGILPGFVAAAALVVLAGDARIVLLGAIVFALASSGWRLQLASLAGLFLFGTGLAVLAIGTAPGFAPMRAMPPEGWRAAAVLFLSVAGLAPLFGWAPWHRPWLMMEAPDAPVTVVAPVVGLYLAVRLLADLCGPATPIWWGPPLLLVGSASAVMGVLAALRAPVFGGVQAGFAVQHGGWMLVGLGVAVVARAADLLPLASLALGGAMLHGLNYTVFASLATLSTEAASGGAGSQTLDRLGGLAARMPVVTAGLLIVGLSLAWLPPGAGFASGWMLLQALFAVPRIGGLPLQLVVAGVLVLLGLSVGFGAAAAIRLVGVAMLGRPRTPRAAAAEDAARSQRGTIAGVAALCVLLGLFPGVALRLTDPAQRLLTAAGLDGQRDWAGLRTQLDPAVYVPLVITALLVAGIGLIAVLLRSGRLAGVQPVPAWEDGFTAPPPWLPFGEPTTQTTAAALATTVPTRLPALPALPRIRVAWEGAWPSFGTRPAALAILMLALICLLAVAVATPA